MYETDTVHYISNDIDFQNVLLNQSYVDVLAIQAEVDMEVLDDDWLNYAADPRNFGHDHE